MAKRFWNWPAFFKTTVSLAVILAVLYTALDLFDIPTRFTKTPIGKPVRSWLLKRLGASEERKIVFPPENRLISVADHVPVTAALRQESKSGESPVRLLDSDVIEDGSRFQRLWVRLDGTRRGTIAGLIPFTFRARVVVPTRGELWLALNHDGAALDDYGVSYRIRVRDQIRETIVLEDRLFSFGSTWRERKVDLEPWSGQEVDLIFAAMSEPSSTPSALTAPVRAYWGDLVLRSRVTRKDRPNIALIVLDTLRPDHMGTYGYGRRTTPNIDEIAENGIVFENAISTSPWTDPAVLSLLTGLYPSDLWEAAPHHEAIKMPLPEGSDSMGEILQRVGYFTIAASDHPGINSGRFGQGFDVFTSLHAVNPWIGWRETEPRKVLNQIERLLRGRSGSGLFFYLHLIYPHVPYNPSPLNTKSCSVRANFVSNVLIEKP